MLHVILILLTQRRFLRRNFWVASAPNCSHMLMKGELLVQGSSVAQFKEMVNYNNWGT